MPAKKKVTNKVTSKSNNGSKDTHRGVNMKRLVDMTVGSGGKSGPRSEFLTFDQFNETKTLRILPPGALEHFFHGCNVGGRRGGWAVTEGDKVNNRMLTCIQLHNDELCPIDQLIEWDEEEGDGTLAEGLKVQSKYLFNVFDRDTEEYYIWAATPGAAKQLKEFANNPKFGDITDPKTGRDILVTKTGNPKQWNSIRYPVVLGDKGPAPAGYEDRVVDLSKFVKMYDRAEMLKIMQANIGALVDLTEIFGSEVPKIEKKSKKGKK